MSYEQCWALNADRSRCEEPAAPDQYFCEEHDPDYGLDPIDIFCLPEAEMPPDVVAYIRDCCPTWPFPEPSPPILAFGAAAAPSPLPAAGSASDPVAAATPPAQDDTLASEAAEEAESLAWLRATLREVIEDVKAGEADPMRKATAIGRLGGLFLRTFRIAELQKENRRLRKSLTAVESCLADLEATATAPPAGGQLPSSAIVTEGSFLRGEIGEAEAAPHKPSSTHDGHNVAGAQTVFSGSAGVPPACRQPGGRDARAPSAVEPESFAGPATTASRASP